MLEFFQVDSFTDKPFAGNPAGVCILDRDLEDQTLKNIAMEMAVSETAFITLNTMQLRWFSPKVEVELCGHATLATVAVLKHKKIIEENQTIHFKTLSGTLSARVCTDNIEMDFPMITVEETSKEKLKLKHLGINEKDVVFYGKAGAKDFIHVKSEKILRGIVPNFQGLVEVPGRAVIVTTRSSLEGYDFISRNFAPWVGVNEDPVTGSSHCALANYWGKRTEKVAMTAFQASERGGSVNMELMDNGRVKLSGKATIIIEGFLRI